MQDSVRSSLSSVISRFFRSFLPLLLVVGIAVFIGFRSINFSTSYSGWDNIHAEFDLGRYARQVFFGAWIEHQSLGAPAAQGHLSEVPRLPILFLLRALLPDNLIRYVFILGMFFVGGVGMYFYLLKAWIHAKAGVFREWLASLGVVFYLLHILTLQQFYISFEMFMVQFAFFPFLLLVVHLLAQKMNAKNILVFFLLQLLIAPSGHTPTVFYLGVLFSLIYAFSLVVTKRGFVKAGVFAFWVGCLTLLANAFWIFPNVYYSVHNSRYVQESRDNQLFAPESVWSIREAGTVANLTSGMHYLFNWKDYSFTEKSHDFIFNEWKDHLAQPFVLLTLKVLGVMTLLGILFVAVDRKKGAKRWAILAMYLFCLAFIWIDLFPTNVILDKLYQSGPFREAFRNPFTKLSILYSFVSIVLFVQGVELLAVGVEKLKVKMSQSQKTFLAKGIQSLMGGVIFILIAGIIFTAWPSFQGKFISEKLKVQYPEQYSEMFAYLNTRDRNLRILQLPQYSHAGWELYDWGFLGEGNGYQGMGFYFFGFPQAFLNRDSDRWVETSDFFYFELKHALDTKDKNHLSHVFQKYNVDIIVIDETKIEPNRDRDYDSQKKLVTDIGLELVWQKDFLSIYERKTENSEREVLAPKKLQFVAGDTRRVRTDVVYQNEGDYVITESEKASVIYPFAFLETYKLDNVIFTDNTTEVFAKLPDAEYTLSLPGYPEARYFVPASVEYKGKTVSVTFPALNILTPSERKELPKFESFEFESEEEWPSVVVFFNDIGVFVNQGQRVFPVLDLEVGKPFRVEYAQKPAELQISESGSVSEDAFEPLEVAIFEPDWSGIQQDLVWEMGSVKNMALVSVFPTLSLNLRQNPSLNCLDKKQGTINTQEKGDGVLYTADGYAVNCNGYTFEDITSTYSYILRVTGKSFQGRGTKLFVNYSDRNIVPEDYLVQDPVFDVYMGLDRVTSDIRATFFLNWETRSFGKESKNELESIELSSFPLYEMAQIKMVDQKKDSSGAAAPVENKVTIYSENLWHDFVHKVDFRCESKKCYIGLDQTYDDLWLGFVQGENTLLPHMRLNNWANLWEVSGSGILVIFYLPELIAQACMGVFAVVLIGVAVKAGLQSRKSN